MKHTALQSKALKVLAAATLAGALLTAAAPAAEAQHFAVGVRVGGPVFFGPRYVAPAPPVVVYGGPGFYGYYGHPDWRFRHDYRYGWRR
jgi:hypothetical protein